MNLSQMSILAVVLQLWGCGSKPSDDLHDMGVGGSETSGTGGQEANQIGPDGSGGESTVAVGGTSSASGATSSLGTGGTGGNDAMTGGTLATTGGTAPSGGVGAIGGTLPVATGGAVDTGGTEPAGGTEPMGGTSSGGTAVAGAGAGGAANPTRKFVGNITSANGRTDVGDLRFADYWDQVSPQNEGKWGSVSSASGQYNWSSLDTMYKYAQDNDLVFKEHTFIWGAQQPGYDITESDVKDWMTQFCERYPDVQSIDVVNEPPPHTRPRYADAMGGGAEGDWTWIANAFKWAREACPNAVLILNDYNNLEWDRDNQHFIDMVNTIKQAGAPIDAIGCQAHDLDHVNQSGVLDVDLEGVTRRFNALIDTVPTIYITEMDISTTDDALQLDLYQQYFPLFWESPNVKGITIWGWVVGHTWSMAPDSGLITTSGTKRPAFTWLLETIGRDD